MKNNAIEFLSLYVEHFAMHIKQGFGFIEKEDVMRQFYSLFPDFKNEIFDKEKLEKWVIEELKWYIDVKNSNKKNC